MIRREGDAFYDAAGGADPTRRVPSCPDWDIADLVWHLAEVHRFWAEIVERQLQDPAEAEAGAPDRPGDLDDLVRLGRDHLERLLQEVLVRSDEDEPEGDLPGLLRHVARHVGGRRILLVLADDGVRAAEVEAVLRSLRLRHEILWLTVTDADPLGLPVGARVRDVGSGRVLPALLEDAPEVSRAFAGAEAARRDELDSLLRRLDVSSARVGSRAEVVPAVVRLLERRRRGR